MKILFYVDSIFPYGSAWSSRARSFSKVFIELGFEVHVISSYCFENNKNVNEIYSFEEYTYQFSSKKIRKFDKYILPFKSLNIIKNYIEKNKVDILFSTRCPFIFNKLHSFTRSKNIPIFLEQCELFDKSTFMLGEFDPYFMILNYQMQNAYRKSDGIVAISTFLFDFFKKQNAKVIRIPTILDVENIEYILDLEKHKKKRIIFAGSIDGKKEILLPIFHAFDSLGDYSEYITLDIYGPNEKKVIKNIDGNKKLFNRLKNNIRILGRVPESVVYEELRKSDFMIFIRPNRVSSNAGFPTKLAESFSVGTPVITNSTGDINLYVENGKNGFIVNEFNSDELVNILKMIVHLNSEDLKQMRSRARKDAEKYFNLKSYTDEIDNFFRVSY